MSYTSLKGYARTMALESAPYMSLAQLMELYDRGIITLQDYDHLAMRSAQMVNSAPAPIVPPLAGQYIRQEP